MNDGQQRLIAIETAGAQCGVALWAADQLLSHRHLESGHGHAVELAPLIQSLCADTGIAVSSLSTVAVTVGPGGFTGIRVGLAMARGLALGTGCRIVGIDAFQRLAWGARTAGHAMRDRNLVVIDSRRSELFAVILDKVLLPAAAPFLVADPIEAARCHAAQSLISDHPLANEWSANGLAVSRQLPDAVSVGEMALSGNPAFCLPAQARYLRPADVSKPKGH